MDLLLEWVITATFFLSWPFCFWLGSKHGERRAAEGYLDELEHRFIGFTSVSGEDFRKVFAIMSAVPYDFVAKVVGPAHSLEYSSAFERFREAAQRALGITVTLQR